MARPPAKELTERELEVMHVFWKCGAQTVAEVRDALAEAGLDRAYTTVATLVRILADKGFLDQTNQERPVFVSTEAIISRSLEKTVRRADRSCFSRLKRAVARTATGAQIADLRRACFAARHLAPEGETNVNAIGLMLLGSIAHATVFALIGALFYLAFRRSSPAAGALAAASSLFFMAIVSVVVLGPWPVWWTIATPRSETPGQAPGSSSAAPAEARSPEERLADSARPASAAPRVAAERHGEMQAQPRASMAALSGRANPRRHGPRDERRRFRAGAGRYGLRLVSSPACVWASPAWASGFLAVARLRSRSRPIDDSLLDEEIQLLRAELSCTRRVEVRESSELETPATLGWRQPLLLLPFDWRDWGQTELRAVLAHELAHVIRGDFLTGLIAQISVAIHFYHPLAHWLAKRLRLEQELAADAWGAALSGGGHTYLVTLAQMALRT